MRIGIVCVIKESWGGSEELWAEMAQQALSQDHEIIISAYNCREVHPKMSNLLNKGAKIIYRRGYIKPGIPAIIRIVQKGILLIKDWLSSPFKKFIHSELDIVLYNGTSFSAVHDAGLFKRLNEKKIPYVYLSQLASDYYLPFANYQIPTIANAFLHAKKNLFVSERNIQTTERKLAVKIPHAAVVRNPVNMPDTDAIAYPSTEEQIQFALVGNLIVLHKGQDLALEVLSSPQWRSRNWHLNIYGAGGDKDFLQQLIKHYNLNDRVTLHGKVNDIKALWRKNHLLIMPSLMEGMPLAIVEAMLCARPSVVTDVGGHTEWITDGIEGFVAEGPSTASLQHAMERAWNHKDDWGNIGLAARSRALSLYDPTPGKTLLLKLLND